MNVILVKMFATALALAQVTAHPDSVKGYAPKANWIIDHFGDHLSLDDDGKGRSGSKGGDSSGGGDSGKKKRPVNGSGVSVSVRNGTVITGLAARAAGELKEHSFTVADAGNAEVQTQAKSRRGPCLVIEATASWSAPIRPRT